MNRLLQEQADAFRAQDEDEHVRPEWNLLTGMGKNMPIFSEMIAEAAPNLYEDDDMILYMNTAHPYETDPDRRAMSLVHILAVPKQRIYNAATLREGDEHLILHMMDQFTEFITEEQNVTKVGCQMAITCIPHLTTPELRYSFTKSLNEFMYGNWGKKSIGFYFHLHPHHSIGHLHMHCILEGPNFMTNVSAKSTPAKTVIENLLARVQSEKDQEQ